MAGQKVTIAPLVLLSVVDHYKRLSTPRVIGVLLGSCDEKAINVTNSFAVPFEELDDEFFLDTSYLQNMFDLYYKVNCKEKIVGWYHSGPKLHNIDLEITKAMTKYCRTPILSVINVHLGTNDIPCQVFKLNRDGEFSHMNVQIGADETEEVGVEHLLRDIKEGTGCSIKDKVSGIVDSLKMYEECLSAIIQYLDDVQGGKKPNKKILNLFQEILDGVPKYDKDVNMSQIYVAELANTLIAMNDCKRNKLEEQKQ